MATKKSKPDGDSTATAVVLTVTAKRDGFRRCGMVFGKTPIEVTVTQEEADILMAEPMLTAGVAE